MEFPELVQAKENITDLFFAEQEMAAGDICVIASPYRICPLGAHIDHQGGPVLGMTINAYTLLAFAPTADGTVRLKSKNYPGKAVFELDRIPETTGGSWDVYVRAAALALKETYPINKGIAGVLDGMLPGCGLSSSASVLLAYLHAFAAANQIRLQPWDYVHLTQRAENKYIGLENGILDQASIVFGHKDRLLHIDTKEKKIRELPKPPEKNPYRILVAYSGYSRELTTSGYNTRVQECRQAAARLSHLAGSGLVRILSDVPDKIFDRYGHKLAPEIGRRANHFFSEVQRVRKGVIAWRQGSLDEFGQLMLASCRSSMEQYECGIQPIFDLQEIVSSADGMLGSRFMGGGFGGCVVGFVKRDRAEAAAANIQQAYRKLHPEVADAAKIYLADSADGAGFLT
ncbi:MAG: galactokinase family protein [Desulfobacterales bacterium]|jgi:galactokinase/galacturonokinase